MMDISLSEGDIVGVVIEKDPMGNKERWFVDNGGKWFCFIPKNTQHGFSSENVVITRTENEFV